MSAPTAHPMPKVKSLGNWYGSNRMSGAEVGRYLGRREWVGVGCCGGLSEIPYIDARSLLITDLHRHMINLAQVTGHPRLGPQFYRRAKRLAFHPETLAAAQARCRQREVETPDGTLWAPTDFIDGPDLEWALDYFVCCWMGRGANAGTDGEFRSGLSVRYDAGGGDSAVRYRNAVRSLVQWRRFLERANCVVLDVFDLVAVCQDVIGHALYIDPPWVEEGDKYRKKFGESDHRRLAREVGRFRHARVVMRYGDHPLIRELYPESHWKWLLRTTRGQSNGKVAEALIINDPNLAVAA